MTDYADVAPEIMEMVRAACLALPETSEEQAWTGRRWCVRKRTFCHVYAVDRPVGPVTIMTFRAPEPDFGVLAASGHPFFRPGWGTNVMAMVLTLATDPDEVTELLTESYCVLAPKKLVDRVARPD